MKKELSCSRINGKLSAIPSKSDAHRLLICAALGNDICCIECPQTSKDIEATAACLVALGAEICYINGIYSVSPIKTAKNGALLPCGESGSTLRFLLPIVCGLGIDAVFELEGRLPERPLSPLKEELERHGAKISLDGNKLYVGGKICGSDYTIAANISSQFISGLLFMLTLVGGTLTLTEKTESSGYIEMTLSALRKFKASIERSGNVFSVHKGTLSSPKRIKTEGDWSNSAFFLAAGCFGNGKVCVEELDAESAQGDKEIVDILKRFGAEISFDDGAVTAVHSKLSATEIDASQIPDLVPILAVTAAAAEGTSHIYGTKRLRLKESDRLETTAKMINSLGGKVEIINDELFIHGTGSLDGGVVSSENDHRIAMSAAAASLICSGNVLIEDSQAVEKSYPAFWADFEKLTAAD